MEAGVAKPVMNATPSGQPILFVKLSHTREDDALSDQMKDMTDTVKKTRRLRPTFNYSISECMVNDHGAESLQPTSHIHSVFFKRKML